MVHILLKGLTAVPNVPNVKIVNPPHLCVEPGAPVGLNTILTSGTPNLILGRIEDMGSGQ